MSDALYPAMQDLSGARLSEANYVGQVIENDVLRVANDRGEAVPTAGDAARDKLHGAVVFDPEPGLHRNVCYPDYSAMYPNIMVDLNASPETIVAVGDAALQRSQYDRRDVQWSYIDPRPVKRLTDGEQYNDFTDGEYKIVYDPSASTIKWRDSWDSIQDYLTPVFFAPKTEREGLLASRAETYIEWNKSYSGTMYSATKRTRNGLFGVSGDTGFPLFDWRVAEAVTIAGRMLLEYGADTLVDRVSNTFDCDVYVAMGDTDGFGVAVDDASLQQDAVLDAVQRETEWVNDTGVPSFVNDEFGVQDTMHEIEVESFAPSLFIPATNNGNGDDGVKKTYAERVTWSDGERVDELHVTGFEAKRSDVADVTVSVQSAVLEAVLYNASELDTAREEAYSVIHDAVSSIRNREYEYSDIGERSGMSKPPEEYGSKNRRPQPTYRGALYAKQQFDGENVFSKPMKFPVESVTSSEYPSTYTSDTAEDGDAVDYVAVEDPSNIPDAFTIDVTEVARSTLRQPVEPILETLGWSWQNAVDGVTQNTLSAFDAMGGDA